MKKVFLFLTMGCLFSISATSQGLCAFDYKMEELKKQNPEYVQLLQQNEQYIRNFIAANPQIARKPMVAYTIPVVVHVMHTGGEVGTSYNPSDAQIIGAIDYLNKVFEGTYPGMQEPVEGGGVVNLELKFVLAKRTSGCGYTNGINRVDASGMPGYKEEGVNRANTGGVTDLQIKNYSRWNPADYYNIWLVNKIDGKDGYIGSGQFIAGYAYFAGSSASLDGTVMLSSQMRTGQKTLPHEVGHAFNLHHTFYDSDLNTTCPTNIDCLAEGDLVCDTDPVSNNVNSSGVNSFTPRSGLNNCASRDYTRNTESNFMAYTNTYTLFTNGQKARVQAAMTLPGRASLIASQGATSCGININFSTLSDGIKEESSGTTTGCRTYKDYEYKMNIGEAASADAVVTLSFGGLATKGLDYDVTTNGDFSNLGNELTFAAGSTTDQPFTIRVYDDANVEADETVIVNYSLNTSGNAVKGTERPTFTLTLKDNDESPKAANNNTYQVGGFTHVIENVFNAGNSKHRGQFLYKASELLAAGITKGPVTSMQLNVYQKLTTGNFNAFTIKIGSATAGYLGEGPASGFITVYNNASLSTTQGWNTFNFSTPYVWDGISSLVVEYCYSSTTGTGADKLGMYQDGGTESQFNILFQNGIDCSGQFTTYSYFQFGLKPAVKFGLNHPATEVETTTSGSRSEYLVTGSNDYFYSNSGKIMARILDLNADLGCVQVAVENAGSSWLTLPFGKRSAKVFAVTPSTNGSSTSHTISLYFTKEELDGKDPATLKIAKTTAASIGEISVENTEIVTPVLTSLEDNSVFTASFTGFSRFFLIENPIVLPVSLLSFTGILNQHSEVDLSWKITNQRNFKGSDVEHSQDGRLFTSIGFVFANQVISNIQDYSFTDKMVRPGMNYYRLKMIDTDGNFTYSDIVRIVNLASGQFVTLMSNPVKEAITLTVNNNDQRPLFATLYSTVGAKVATWQLGSRTGSVELPIGKYKLTPGVYLLKVSDGNRVTTVKVMKN